jgi:hypothetical protein
MEQIEAGQKDSTISGAILEREEQKHQTEELAILLGKAFHAASKASGGDSSALTRVQTELLDKLKRLLRIHGRLVVDVDPSGIRWKGHTLYEDDGPGGLVDMLCRAGVQELHFYPGISDWELAYFLEILEHSRHDPRATDDLVADLQEDEDLPHVDCVASDSYLEIHPLPIPHGLDDVREQYPHRPMPPAIQDKIFREYARGSPMDFLKRRSKDHAFRAGVLMILNRLYQSAPEEIERMNRQIVWETSSGSGIGALGILTEVLLMERSQKGFDRMLSVMFEFLDDALKTGDFHRAATVLMKFYGCLRSGSVTEWQSKALRKGIFEAGTEARVNTIARGLKSVKGDGLNELSRYLSLLQRNAVPHLCRLLGEIGGSKTRRIICDSLAGIGRSSVEVFGAFLSDKQWYVVRNIVYVLGRIGRTECVPYIEKALNHADPRVRREAVQAISRTAGSKEALEYLRAKLDDEDRRTRGLAALRMARVGGEAATTPLIDLISSKSFQKRDVREIRLLLEAIGLTGSNQAVAVLSRILQRKSLFGKTRTDTIRKSAAEALGTIGTREALDALREASRAADEVARTISLSVLEKSEHQG